jgi:CRP-like cAMP-binding protein
MGCVKSKDACVLACSAGGAATAPKSSSASAPKSSSASAPLSSAAAGEPDVETLGRLAPFRGLDEPALRAVAKALVRVKYAANAVVLRAGEVDDRVLVLASGDALLTCPHRGFHIEVHVKPGDLVNVVALQSPAHAHRTTLATRSECVFFALDKRAVKALASATPGLASALEASKRDREAIVAGNKELVYSGSHLRCCHMM